MAMVDINNRSPKTSKSFCTQLSFYSLEMKYVEKWVSSVHRGPIRVFRTAGDSKKKNSRDRRKKSADRAGSKVHKPVVLLPG